MATELLEDEVIAEEEEAYWASLRPSPEEESADEATWERQAQMEREEARFFTDMARLWERGWRFRDGCFTPARKTAEGRL